MGGVDSETTAPAADFKVEKGMWYNFRIDIQKNVTRI